jgi:hypothetical protein
MLPLNWGREMSTSRKSWIRRVLIIFAVAYIAFLGFIWWAMRQPPERFGRVMASMPTPAYFVLPFETMWTHARAGTLHRGDTAPDFTLAKLDKSEHIQLSSLNSHQPVVLVFGSYT